jgi:hypothetical protein
MQAMFSRARAASCSAFVPTARWSGLLANHPPPFTCVSRVRLPTATLTACPMFDCTDCVRKPGLEVTFVPSLQALRRQPDTTEGRPDGSVDMADCGVPEPMALERPP